MRQLVITYLPWLLSGITIYMTVLQGNLNKKAWVVGLINQLFWTIWIVVSGTWGLLLLNICLWYLYTRNHLKWSRRLP